MVNLTEAINEMINKRKKMISDGHSHHASALFGGKKCKKVPVW